jgi:hypothetical protein
MRFFQNWSKKIKVLALLPLSILTVFLLDRIDYWTNNLLGVADAYRGQPLILAINRITTGMSVVGLLLAVVFGIFIIWWYLLGIRPYGKNRSDNKINTRPKGCPKDIFLVEIKRK